MQGKNRISNGWGDTSLISLPNCALENFEAPLQHFLWHEQEILIRILKGKCTGQVILTCSTNGFNKIKNKDQKWITFNSPTTIAPFCFSSEGFKFVKASSFTITPFVARAQLTPLETPSPSPYWKTTLGLCSTK